MELAVKRALRFPNLAFTAIHSASVMSFALVFFLVLTDTALLAELSLDCDALSLVSIEPDASWRGTMELVGVGVIYTREPFPNAGSLPWGGGFLR